MHFALDNVIKTMVVSFEWQKYNLWRHGQLLTFYVELKWKKMTMFYLGNWHCTVNWKSLKWNSIWLLMKYYNSWLLYINLFCFKIRQFPKILVWTNINIFLIFWLANLCQKYSIFTLFDRRNLIYAIIQQWNLYTIWNSSQFKLCTYISIINIQKIPHFAIFQLLVQIWPLAHCFY